MPEQKTGQQKGTQMRITDAEKSLIKNTFKNRYELLQLMRKMFLPEVDPKAPIGQVIDLWLTIDLKDLSPEEAYVRLLARNQLIAHVDQCLMQLNILAETEAESEAEEIARVTKNSNK